MTKFRWLTRFSQFGLESWLSLPLVAVGIWAGSQWLNSQVLSETYTTTTQLDAEQQQQVSLDLTLTILSIYAEVNRGGGVTEVTIQTGGSDLKELQFEYPVTEFADVERAIAREFNLSSDEIRTLIRYHID
ncbi:hypothetical protein IFO70_38740 [Phormidium tenue FACHB-886]|nr:hypothetical protein [Phormidium tenue FACHB-886]